MPFWLGIAIAEQQEGGEGRSVRVEADSFSSIDGAVDRLMVIASPAVAGQATAANAYMVCAGTMQEAIELLVAVFERRETSPQVTLVATGIETPQVERQPSDQEALSHVHGELCPLRTSSRTRL